jgi:hypothetical protein
LICMCVGKPYVGLRQRRWLGTKKMSCHRCLDRQFTPPHFLITLASLKSPVAGLLERDRADVTFFARQRFCAQHDRNRIEAFNRLTPRMTVISDHLFRRFKFLRCKIAFHFRQILIPVSRYRKLLFGTRCRRYGFAI